VTIRLRSYNFPDFKEKRPELRAALLKKLKELGRVPEDKQ
jgi:hypothetical protein